MSVQKNGKKIMLVSYGFYPEQSPRSFRATELAKEFFRRGHQVTVLAPARKGLKSFLDEYPINFIDIGEISWKVPRIEINSRIAHLFNRAISRITGLLFEYPVIQLTGKVSKALKNKKGYDLLISIAVPHPVHWGVAMAWNKRGKENPAPVWIADCGDPYMGDESDSFKKPFYFSFVEKWMFRKTNYITVPTDGSYEGYYKEFHPKIRVIPQGFRFEDIRMADYKPNAVPTFAYAGALIPGNRDAKELLRYLGRLPLDFKFNIYTRDTHHVTPHLVPGDGRIELKEFVTRDKLLYELSKLDFLVNFENNTTRQTPSKLIDYAIIGKPVLSIKTGNLDEDAVQEFLRGNYRKSLILNDPGQYRIESVCEKFLNLC